MKPMRRPSRPLVAMLALVMTLSPLTAEIAAAQSSAPAPVKASSGSAPSFLERLGTTFSNTTKKLWSVWGYGSGASSTLRPPPPSTIPAPTSATPAVKPGNAPAATPLAPPKVTPVVEAPVPTPKVTPVAEAPVPTPKVTPVAETPVPTPKVTASNPAGGSRSGGSLSAPGSSVGGSASNPGRTASSPAGSSAGGSSGRPSTPVARSTSQATASPPRPVTRVAAPTTSAPVTRPVARPTAAVLQPVTQVRAPVSQPVVRPTATVAKPVVKPTATLANPVVKPTATVVKPVTQVRAPVSQPVVNPTATVAKPVVQPTATVAKPAVQPTATVPKPVVQPTAAVAKPVVQPSATVAKPATLAPPTGATSAATSGSSAAAAKPVAYQASQHAPGTQVGPNGRPLGPQGYPMQFGKVSGMAARRLGISNAQAAKAFNFLKRSPLFQQLLTPLHPSNIGLAVGATAGMNLWNQMKSGEEIDLGKAMSFVGEKSFWGGVVGSGVGYALMARVAFQFFPLGVGLVPGLGMIFPVFAGMAGSIAGWELGSGMIQGRSMEEIFKEMDLVQVAGQAVGSTVGMLVGAHYGAMLGAIGGPIGAIIGSILFAPVGASIVNSVVGMFVPGGGGDVQAAQRETENVLGKITQLEKLLGGGPLTDQAAAGAAQAVEEAVAAELPGEAAASMDLDADASTLKASYDLARERLQGAISEGDRAGARRWLQAMKMAAQLYQAELDKEK